MRINISFPLAIIIPAYKVAYLKQTLESLCRQQDSSFNVYIGDDASPGNIEAIVSAFENRLHMHYQRFEKNIGASNLVAQWQRCIDLSSHEPWIWLLPDDDMAGESCVGSFISQLETNPHKTTVFRFQTTYMDALGNIIHVPAPPPKYESNVDFLINKLKFERSSSVAEYIFSRDAFKKAGGFNALPLAWGSDDLLWIRLSEQQDIETLPEGKVYLRQSSENISSLGGKLIDIKFEAKYELLNSLLKDKKFITKLLNKYSLSEFKKIISDHLFFEYKSFGVRFLNAKLIRYSYKNNQLLGGGILKNLYRLLRFQFKN